MEKRGDMPLSMEEKRWGKSYLLQDLKLPAAPGAQSACPIGKEGGGWEKGLQPPLPHWSLLLHPHLQNPGSTSGSMYHTSV